VCIGSACTQSESYGGLREVELSKTRSPIVGNNMMGQKLQGAPMKHVQEVCLLFFGKSSLSFKIQMNYKNCLFDNIVKIEFS